MAMDVYQYYKTNLIIWISILAGVVVLMMMVLVMNYGQFFYEYNNTALASEVIYILALSLACIILFLKRSVFRLDKLLDRGSVLATVAERKNYVFSQLRRNYIIIWVLSEILGILGFIFYLFSSDLRNSILFTAVSIFSLVTNFPSKRTIRICLENINPSEKFL
jgi:hypothetical protein